MAYVCDQATYARSTYVWLDLPLYFTSKNNCKDTIYIEGVVLEMGWK